MGDTHSLYEVMIMSDSAQVHCGGGDFHQDPGHGHGHGKSDCQLRGGGDTLMPGQYHQIQFIILELEECVDIII